MSATVIHVGGAPQKFHAFADFLDGKSAVVRRAALSMDETSAAPCLLLSLPEQSDLRWPLAAIRRLPDQAGRDTMVLTLHDDAVRRLVLRDEAVRKILTARCPNLKARPRVANRGKLLGWSLGAIASVALIIFVLVPVMADQLAEFLPPDGERALGDATFEQIRTALSVEDFVPVRICETRRGVAALDTMTARLETLTDLPYPLAVNVLDHDLVNAFALPGGRVVLFRGLIDAADGPDEVAAVLAHEIGHVAARDPARRALRSAGSIGVLGLILGDFAGGAVVLFLVERLIDANYSRDAEAAADQYAFDLLVGAGVRPSALATFFERLQQDQGDGVGILAHFQSHPELGDRISAARSGDTGAATFGLPSLNAREWARLRRICD
ncbi:M48 family metallopeptidase [Rhodobacteraceae bacterium R_SAG10]|nr:M48 family metallopeptidase [Rhodobacteraceae bacterium R_SAG10]